MKKRAYFFLNRPVFCIPLAPLIARALAEIPADKLPDFATGFVVATAGAGIHIALAAVRSGNAAGGAVADGAKIRAIVGVHRHAGY